MTTTRIGLISDLHGNIVALDAVFAELRRTGVDRIVCLGDVAPLGPRPREVLHRLEEEGCDCILGNHDEFMLDADLVHRYSEVPIVVESVDWCRSELGPRELDFIRGFARTLQVPLDATNELLLFHGTPGSNMTDLLATTPRDVVDEMLGGRRAQVMAGGHTHIQMLRQHGGALIVNPGSVGMPFKEHAAGGPPQILPHAEFAVVTSRDGCITVELGRVPLDRRTLRAEALAVDFPMSAALSYAYA